MLREHQTFDRNEMSFLNSFSSCFLSIDLCRRKKFCIDSRIRANTARGTANYIARRTKLHCDKMYRVVELITESNRFDNDGPVVLESTIANTSHGTFPL